MAVEKVIKYEHKDGGGAVFYFLRLSSGRRKGERVVTAVGYNSDLDPVTMTADDLIKGWNPVKSIIFEN